MFLVNGHNETSSCVLEESNVRKAMCSVLLSFVIVVGGFGNVFMSFMVFRHTEMRSAINILLAVMSISDGLISILCAPLDLTTVIMNKWVFGNIICCAHNFLLSVFVVHNIIILVIISTDRYYILVNKKGLLKNCNSFALIVCSFALAVAASSPPVFGVGQFPFSNGYCARTSTNEIQDIVYYGVFSSLLFVLPCGLMFVAYVYIIVNLKKRTLTVRPEIQHGSPSGLFVMHQGIDVRFKQKTFTTILFLYLAIVIFKMPMAISLLSMSVQESVRCPISLWLIVLTYLNSAINPFIYVFKITTYWMALTGKFYSVRKNVINWKQTSVRRHPENIYGVRVTRPSKTSII
ncbi:hypothetical protein JTE90_017729 [Oedothorax gibbosus]|uniref:G-protein coupled receptors family 1 profile domain-containing protein n=1 Tax=Oedothorax gibbosus TaxID=931172 RepID=A0AAV6UBQ1_9ARAC|nr:hypothetical protein JTE90_017729 [Oedothorax gibbosus]